MSQTIALQARAPQVSLADVMRDVQQREMNDYKIQEMARQDQLGAMDTRQKLDQGEALDRYRMRAKDKDPAAAEELDAYPEMAKKLHDAFDGMSPEQYREAAGKAKAFAEAARRVSSFPEGSAEQGQAWQIEIDKLWKGGFIDEQYRDLWKKSGPNADIINEALDIGKWAESYTGKNAVNRARAANLEGKTENEAALTQARIGTEQSKAGLNETRGRVAEQNVESLDAYRTRESERKTGDTEADNVRADKTAESLDTYRTGEAKRKAEDTAADNARADKNVESQIKTRESKGTGTGSGSKKDTPTPGTGEAGSDLSPNEYGRRIRDVQKIINRRREKEFLTDDQVLSLERELRKKYRIPDSEPSISGLDPAGGAGAGVGTKDNIHADPNAKPPPMTERVIGKVYPTPKGPMEWTENGWRPAVNG